MEHEDTGPLQPKPDHSFFFFPGYTVSCELDFIILHLCCYLQKAFFPCRPYVLESHDAKAEKEILMHTGTYWN